jgi:dihydropyrimidinase
VSTFELTLRGGNVVSGTEVREADLGINDGVITAVGDLDGTTAERTIDARGLYVLPGVIDVHNHPVYEDDFEEMCLAAATGGITTVVPFIGAIPAWGFAKSTPLRVIKDFVETWQGRVACDFGVHAAIDAEDDLALEIEDLIRYGVTSFKFFMAYKQRGMMSDDETLIRNFDLIAKCRALAMVHAENGAAIAFLEGQEWDAATVANDYFLSCHTDLSEAEAVMRAIALADAVGCSLYIPHLAAAEALEAVRIARRASSITVHAETCPHYLLLTNDEVLERGALSKIAPPLRNFHDNEALWAGIANGEIQVVATDHAARSVGSKISAKNLLQAPYGAESIEHLLPLMFSEGVRRERIDIRDLVRLLAENPADIFGLAPRKGRITVGADADIVVFAPERTVNCSAATHVTTSDYCLYEGRVCQGAPLLTLRRGQVTYDAQSDRACPRGGRFIPARSPQEQAEERASRSLLRSANGLV